MNSVCLSCRSISLVGEKERKILKEIVKQAKRPVKSRIIAPGKYKLAMTSVSIIAIQSRPDSFLNPQ